ncbi:MAG: 30S ribosomal protein S15 [Candidatus Nanohaloarchaea archaeon]|nr:30S ribosomal protein S15 [Candidatus Nanohaloarchaea archaeon]
MARMHSRRRGSSGSTRPVNADTDWVIYDADEVRNLVEQMQEEGYSLSGIGRRLRDQYGIPDVEAVTGEQLTAVAETGEFPEDLEDLMRKAVRIEEHLDDNPEDTSARRNLSLVESKIRRLVDYYRGDRIPADWTYNIEKARLVVE